LKEFAIRENHLFVKAYTKGKKYVTEEFGFIAPFDTFEDNERPTDPLAREIVRWMEKPGVQAVPWNFTLFPSAQFKESFGAALLKYAQGNKTWSSVKTDVIANWKKESAAIS
jgi:raffinose/stachyose/melibiose transport system substrate-binding protein